MAHPAHRTGRELQRLLIETSPLIEEYTAAVCPGCADVCCRQKHGMPTERDRLYLTAAGVAPLRSDPALHPDAPCQYLGGDGCMRPRWQRPWRCTWYFCDPLLDALRAGPPRKARALSAALEKMARLHNELTGKDEVS
jgi:hypothetical protein